MADLRVDDGVLADCELRLSRLHREFGHLDARRDHLATSWGAAPMSDAMDDFLDDWAHYRARLLSRIETVGRQVGATRTAFGTADQRLAAAAGRR